MPSRPDQTPLIFLGATAFPEIAEVARDINRRSPVFRIAGILDDDARLHGRNIEGTPVLGPLEMVHSHPDASFVLGIGSHKTRLARYDIVRRLGLPPERYATLVHPAGKVYPSTEIGHGCVLYPGAVVFCGSRVEDFVIILANSIIGYENVICEGALITSLVAMTTNVAIGHYAHVGTHSCVGERMTVGPGAQVSMGSIVLRHVPPGVFSFGNPQQFIQKVDVHPELLERWKEFSPTSRSQEG